MNSGSLLPCRTGGSILHHLARGQVRRTVDHQAESALWQVVAEQHDGPRKIRVLHLRHREQERWTKTFSHVHSGRTGDRFFAIFRRSATNARISSRRDSSSGARRIDDGCTVAVTSGASGDVDERAALLRHLEVPAQQRLRGGRAETDQHPRLHQRDLGLEPRTAGADLAAFGLA